MPRRWILPSPSGALSRFSSSSSAASTTTGPEQQPTLRFVRLGGPSSQEVPLASHRHQQQHHGRSREGRQSLRVMLVWRLARVRVSRLHSQRSRWSAAILRIVCQLPKLNFCSRRLLRAARSRLQLRRPSSSLPQLCRRCPLLRGRFQAADSTTPIWT